jgi:hypothetical protein
MKRRFLFSLGMILFSMTRFASPATGTLNVPKVVEAGAAFSIATSGSGNAVLYIVGPGQVLRRKLQLGQTADFAPGDLYSAGHYVALLVEGSSAEQTEFDVVAARQPAGMSFFAKPSRIPVDLRQGISGVVYVFDRFHNLVLEPVSVSFQLSGAGAAPALTAMTHNGVAWLKVDSATKSGAAQFQAKVGSFTGKRVVQQVPGDPCNIKISARPSGQRIALETDPVRDCRGNPVTDGTIVTFTENFNGSQSVVDVPLKRGVARTDMPAHPGAVISVASGVVMGNEIRWEAGK